MMLPRKVIRDTAFDFLLVLDKLGLTYNTHKHVSVFDLYNLFERLYLHKDIERIDKRIGET